MQGKGFFTSLFDYSFSSYITPRIIKILYVLATVLVALWTLAIILVAFQASSTLGILTLLIVGPLYFVIAMIWVRVGLEVLSAFFNIHYDVQEIKQRAGGAGGTPVASGPSPATLGPVRADDAEIAVPVAGSPPETRQEPAVTATAVESNAEVASPAASSSAPEPASAPPRARYCENCGAERRPDARFCTSCGHA